MSEYILLVRTPNGEPAIAVRNNDGKVAKYDSSEAVEEALKYSNIDKTNYQIVKMTC